MAKHAKPPGLSRTSMTLCSQLSLRKERNNRALEQTDEKENQSSDLKSDDNNLTQLESTTRSTSTSHIDIFQFYGAFLSQEKTYVRQVQSPTQSNAYHVKCSPQSARSLEIWSGQYSLQHTQDQAKLRRESTQSRDDHDESITWEEFQAQKKHQEHEKKAKEIALLARDNELLLLGKPTSLTVDLMEFTPVVEPLVATAASMDAQQLPPNITHLDLRAPTEKHDPSSQTMFGGMILNGLCNKQHQKQKAFNTDASAASKIVSPSPQMTLESEDNSLHDSENLIEL